MGEDSSIDRARYDFKKAMQEIVNLRGRGTELISVYVPASKQISDVTSYLRNEYSQSTNIKSKTTRKNVMSAIESIMARLKTFNKVPENGLVVFCGEISMGGDQTRMVQYVLEPPEPITTFIYRCDSQFFVEPLLDMLREKKSYGLIVMDRSEASIGILTGKKITLIKNFDSQVPRKHRQGGQSAQRFERLIEIAAHEFFKKIADNAEEAFLNRDDLQGILIGGPGATKDYFVKEGYLHHELQKKVIDTFDTGYTDEYGLKELVNNAAGALQDMDIMRERELIQRLLTEIRKERGGLSAYGEEQVRQLLVAGAVDTVLLSEGLNLKRIKITCSNGHVQEFTARKVPSKAQCDQCDSPVESVEEIGLVDHFYDLAETVGSKVELISEDSEEGEMLIQAFGGVAALLRFQVMI